jgi:hypothetical protein
VNKLGIEISQEAAQSIEGTIAPDRHSVDEIAMADLHVLGADGLGALISCGPSTPEATEHPDSNANT